MLLFLWATALTALLTNVTGHRKMCHAHRVPSRDGDWNSLFRYVGYTAFSSRTRGRSLRTFLTAMFFRKARSVGQSSTAKFRRSALCYGNRSFILELGVLTRATSRVLSVAATVTSVGAPCEPTALGAGVTFCKSVLSVDREVFSVVSGGGRSAVNRNLQDSNQIKQTGVALSHAHLLPKNQVRFSLQSSALLTGTFFLVFPVHPGKVMDIT